LWEELLKDSFFLGQIFGDVFGNNLDSKKLKQIKRHRVVGVGV